MPVNKLVYLAPLKWQSYAQRPHFMMRYLADTSDVKILWVDPFPARLPKLADLSRRHDVYNQGTKAHPDIQMYSHRPLPIEPLLGCSKLYETFYLQKIVRAILDFVGNDVAALGIGKPCCLAKMLLEKDIFFTSFYDAMDDYPEFHTGISKKYISSIMKTVASGVDQVYASSHFLENKFRAFNDNVLLVPNGYDGLNLAPGKNLLQRDMQQNDTKIIGYVGTIYHWFDWELVIAIARLFPAVTIKLIGPVLGHIPSHLPANIVMLPPCSNEEAMRYMSSFDVGLIPFLKNNATRAVDPIKYYEYRALNLPVISTLFGDMQHKVDDPGLFLVSDTGMGALMPALESALSYKCGEDDFSLRLSSTWSSRFKEASILGEYLGRS
ncbi:MAG: glycosyl transferase [Gammaproteobacteria bacterium]|nr:glycosyl transferase [Gammaproteobacteria bacterium]